MSAPQASPRGRGPRRGDEQRGEQHREQYSERGQATPSIVAVVSVVAVVVAMVAFFAGGDDTATDTQAQGDVPTAQTPTPQAEPAGPQTAARTPAREQGDQGEQPGRARDGDRRGAEDGEQKKRRQPRTDPDDGPPDVYVEVYNNTGISGLAASTAAELQDAGWQVVGADNWYGDIPEDTVYYPSGLEAEADELAEVLGVGRVRGAVAPMKFDRLTVILTDAD